MYNIFDLGKTICVKTLFRHYFEGRSFISCAISCFFPGCLVSNVQSVTRASAAVTWWWELGKKYITWSAFGARCAAGTSCLETNSPCERTNCCAAQTMTCWSGPLQEARWVRTTFTKEHCTYRVPTKTTTIIIIIKNNNNNNVIENSYNYIV